jgi:hypothetical protein
MPMFKYVSPFLARAAAVFMLAALPWVAFAGDLGRVGRIVEMKGDVSFYDPDRDEWTEALRNRPITTGDRLVLAHGARAELRIGSTVLLLAQGTDLEVLDLDDDRLRLELHRGSMALRVPSRNIAEETEIRTRETRLRPLRAGQYRIDREDGSTYAAVLRGEMESSGHGNLLLISSGERHEIWIDEKRDVARARTARMPDDRLAAWAEESFRAEERRADAHRYASPDIPGIEELDRHGRWDTHPEYGAVWYPIGVSAGWQPFRDGRWVWMRPWGWTWVDAQPWGFAPSHYGRWVNWGGRWAWWPGPRGVRPVFTPALVAWVGGSNGGVSISIGGHGGYAPPSAWVPLAPYQPYVPIVVPRPRPPRHPSPPPPKYYPPQVPTGPISRPAPPSYGSQGVPIGVQAVPAARPAPVAVPVSPAPQAAPVATPGPQAPVMVAPPSEQRRSPAPFSAPPPQADKQSKSEKPEKSEKQDSRGDQRRRDQVQ